MITDIFSSFDPAINNTSSTMSGAIFWTLSSSMILLLFSSLWMASGRLQTLLTLPTHIMNSQLSRTFSVNLKGMMSLLTPLFIMIISVNLMGLLPYVFSSSSHLMFTLSFGLVLWLGMIMSAMVFDPYTFAANLLPGGAPMWLNPLLVLIETISIMVRPITLSFRLAANMTAGHIVLTLLGAYTMTAILTSPLASMLLLPTEILYTLFEVGICLIQAYIFCLLLSLYSDDHPSN
nr:ATP synthase F0 subunit 6 [Pherusa bengalensis]